MVGKTSQWYRLFYVYVHCEQEVLGLNLGDGEDWDINFE